MEICSNDFEDLRTHYETDLGKALDMERKIAKPEEVDGLP